MTNLGFDELVSIPDLCALTRRDRRWIERRLANLPVHGEARHPKYRLAAAVAAFCEPEPPDEAAMKEIADQQRKMAADADRQEMKARKEAEAMVDMVDVAGALKDWAVKFVAFLSGMSLTVAQRDQILSHARNSITAVTDELAADKP